MINVCAQCGSYRPDKEIQQNPSRAICPDCGHSHPFVQQPLFIVCGSSGGGKTAVCRRLLGQTLPFIPLEADILYNPAIVHSDDAFRDFNEMWLRVCKHIGQAGKPVALFHSGGLPQHMEPCVERRYFNTGYYLALVAEDATITKRLEARPAWRGCTPETIAKQVAYNQWLRQEGAQHTPVITILDTTQANIEETSLEIVTWIQEKLSR